MKFEEQALWSHLDACGIEFRLTHNELIQKYGSYNSGLSQNVAYVQFGYQRPFIKGLTEPLVSQFMPNYGLSAIPNYIHGSILESNDSAENYNRAVTQLVTLFGEGRDLSVSNTVSRKWNFGLATLQATIFPIDLNKKVYENLGVAPPKENNACKIEIVPEFFPAPTETEKIALSSFVEISDYKVSPNRDSHYSISRRAEHIQSRSLGTDEFMKFFIAIDSSNVIHFIPIEWIEKIVYGQIRPAKGGGGIYISARFKPNGVDKEIGFYILNTKFKENAYRPIAITLSEKLSVPLEEMVSDDV